MTGMLWDWMGEIIHVLLTELDSNLGPMNLQVIYLLGHLAHSNGTNLYVSSHLFPLI